MQLEQLHSLPADRTVRTLRQRLDRLGRQIREGDLDATHSYLDNDWILYVLERRRWAAMLGVLAARSAARRLESKAVGA
jgi:hypothetical protein